MNEKSHSSKVRNRQDHHFEIPFFISLYFSILEEAFKLFQDTR